MIDCADFWPQDRDSEGAVVEYRWLSVNPEVFEPSHLSSSSNVSAYIRPAAASRCLDLVVWIFVELERWKVLVSLVVIVDPAGVFGPSRLSSSLNIHLIISFEIQYSCLRWAVIFISTTSSLLSPSSSLSPC